MVEANFARYESDQFDVDSYLCCWSWLIENQFWLLCGCCCLNGNIGPLLCIKRYNIHFKRRVGKDELHWGIKEATGTISFVDFHNFVLKSRDHCIKHLSPSRIIRATHPTYGESERMRHERQKFLLRLRFFTEHGKMDKVPLFLCSKSSKRFLFFWVRRKLVCNF